MRPTSGKSAIPKGPSRHTRKDVQTIMAPMRQLLKNAGDSERDFKKNKTTFDVSTAAPEAKTRTNPQAAAHSVPVLVLESEVFTAVRTLTADALQSKKKRVKLWTWAPLLF